MVGPSYPLLQLLLSAKVTNTPSSGSPLVSSARTTRSSATTSPTTTPDRGCVVKLSTPGSHWNDKESAALWDFGLVVSLTRRPNDKPPGAVQVPLSTPSAENESPGGRNSLMRNQV